MPPLVARALRLRSLLRPDREAIETEERPDAALSGLRAECACLTGAGEKVVLS